MTSSAHAAHLAELNVGEALERLTDLRAAPPAAARK